MPDQLFDNSNYHLPSVISYPFDCSDTESDTSSVPVTRHASPQPKPAYRLPALGPATDPPIFNNNNKYITSDPTFHANNYTHPFAQPAQVYDHIDVAVVLDPNYYPPGPAARPFDDDAFFNELPPLEQDFRYSLFSPIACAYYPDMSRHSPPDVNTNAYRHAASPITQTSTLTTQLQAATPQPAQEEFTKTHSGAISIDTRKGTDESTLLNPTNTSRPIAMANSPRKDMLSGSLLGGMSWGGISVGSFIRDDMLMTGTSPFTFQSPSFHSSSYLPKMEANFMKDYACCGIKLDSLHELLEHYEEEHAAVATQTMGRTPTNQQAYAKIETHRNMHTPSQTVQPQNAHRLPLPVPQVVSGFGSHPVTDLDDLESMDMDEAPAPAVQPVERQYQPQPQFGRQNAQASLNYNGANPFQNPTPPSDHSNSSGNYQHNPTVSSVNAPNMDGMSRNPGDLDLDGLGTPRMNQSDDDFHMASLDLSHNNTIDDPAKRLLGKQGFGGVRSPGLGGAQMVQSSELARRLREQQLANGPSLPGTPDEAKPFRCPVIGCEKAYKNQNGLKYHKQHGHQNQKLKENPDGSFSIVDPTTSIPYPGTVGMEKEKPYRCDTCLKRYKNLNGLKYHRQHNQICNPDLGIGIGGESLAGLAAMAGTTGTNAGAGVNVAGAGLVGETVLGF